MMWICNPLWDGFWLLSGFPIAVIFLLASIWVLPSKIIFWATVILANAHFMSPIVLTWSDRGLRRKVFEAPWWYIGLPVALIGVSLGVGLLAPALPTTDLNFSSVSLTSGNYRNPLIILLAIYVIWNAYHFGMQNFGVLSLYRVKGGLNRRRIRDKWFCLVMIFAATCLPFVPAVIKLGEELSLTHNRSLLRYVVMAHTYGAGVVKLGVLALFAISLVIMLWRERSPPRILFTIVTALAPVLTVWWGYIIMVIHFSALDSKDPVWSWVSGVANWPGVFTFALLAINHWLVALGLSSRVFSRRSNLSAVIFVAPLLLMGAVIWAILFLGLPHLADFYHLDKIQKRLMVEYLIGLAISLRLGLGFVHFLYDRWLWRLRDPQIRGMVQHDLLAFGPKLVRVEAAE